MNQGNNKVESALEVVNKADDARQETIGEVDNVTHRVQDISAEASASQSPCKLAQDLQLSCLTSGLPAQRVLQVRKAV